MRSLSLAPLPRRGRISDAAHDRLLEAILTGRIPPGESLPSERQLSEAWGISRHAVREALSRLQQAQLVVVAQGGATRVLDWRATGGLELLLAVGVDGTGALDADLLRSVLELRACIGQDAARRCAQRGPAPLRREAAELADGVAAERDRERRAALYQQLWERLVEGSGNVAYRLAFNTLVRGLQRMHELELALAPAPSEAGQVAALAAALRGRDGEGAAAAAGELLGRSMARGRRALGTRGV
ncbi:MAG TPA: GntR family transcriptional regulator [Solirubrobacteraceae bacterium]|nr:GntR family transcriptional regulator [Solirubrobacteraceae bacterium]